jgi:ABC-type uncharacterized transport system substrate-binding protein
MFPPGRLRLEAKPLATGSLQIAIVTDGTLAIQALKNATQTVPIVASTRNRTNSAASFGKALPGLTRVAVLLNPANPSNLPLLKQTQAAAPSLNIELYVAEAGGRRISLRIHSPRSVPRRSAL